MGQYTEEITRNAEKINQLNIRIKETFKYRDKNQPQYKEWETACANFHAQYGSLAFPGGLGGAYARILDGDPKAMEAAICFLEVRPYFFRSGYMFKDILKKAKRAPLGDDQRKRLEVVLKAYDVYKASRNAKRRKWLEAAFKAYDM